jgi:hypothetical protein
MASDIDGAVAEAPLDQAEVAGASASNRRGGLPFSAILGAFVGLSLIATASGQLRDVDLYWHILAGRELLSGASARDLGTGWSFAPNPAPWVSTQSLAEVLLNALHAIGGWPALAALRVVTAAVAIAVLAATTLARRPASLAGLPFVLAATSIAVVSQERPQQATLIGAAALGGVLVGGLRRGQLPRWFVILPISILWANLHGGWVLVPAVLGLISIGRTLDHGLQDRTARKALALAVASVVAGALTPAGIAGITAAVRLKGAAEVIKEWQPTQPTTSLGLFTVAMLVLVCVGWSRSGRFPLSEVAAVLACLFFSWTAWRNVAPGLVLLAPMTAARLTDAFPRVRNTEPSWSRPLGVALAAILMITGLISLVGRDHLPSGQYPMGLVRSIAQLPPGQRVLNQYPVGGLVLMFGGPGTAVGIDGRTDRYGAEYVDQYRRLSALSGQWESLLAQLDPTAALIERDTALAHHLLRERGWTQVGQEERDYVLLIRPRSSP